MLWHHEPPHWEARDDLLVVTTAPRTDFWRATRYGFVLDDGHFYYQVAQGDFDAQVKVMGAYRDLYDQAGLMVRVDEANWLKCGIELVEGVQHASVVATRDYSDWSVLPLAQAPAALWLQVARRGDSLEVRCSRDGEHYQLLRLAYLVPVPQVQVGMMCASPQGGGFTASFQGFAVLPPSRD